MMEFWFLKEKGKHESGALTARNLLEVIMTQRLDLAAGDLLPTFSPEVS